MTIKLTIEVELMENFTDETEEGKLWLENEVLVANGDLILHSNNIGDTIGVIKKVSSVEYIFSEI